MRSSGAACYFTVRKRRVVRLWSVSQVCKLCMYHKNSYLLHELRSAWCVLAVCHEYIHSVCVTRTRVYITNSEACGASWLCVTGTCIHTYVHAVPSHLFSPWEKKSTDTHRIRSARQIPRWGMRYFCRDKTHTHTRTQTRTCNSRRSTLIHSQGGQACASVWHV